MGRAPGGVQKRGPRLPIRTVTPGLVPGHHTLGIGRVSASRETSVYGPP